MSNFDPAGHARAMRAGGFWPDRNFDEFLVAAVSAAPDKPALVADRADRPEPLRISYRELEDRVARVAAALRALGIGAGDVVAVQLPNWWEFVVTSLACGRIGAVVNPLMPIFRERELGYMLGFAQARMLVVPKVFRGFDHEAMATSLQRELPGLRHVVVVDGAGANSFDRCLLGGRARVDVAPTAAASALQADALAVLMFTSGTTGSPKGVMHTSNTLAACNNAIAGRAFTVGLDLDEWAIPGVTAAAAYEHDAVATLLRFTGPVIGAINGLAITGGVEIALACDVLIASSAARFADTHVRVGLLPGWGGSDRMIQRIGLHRAKELALTGRFLGADEALAWGFVNRVVAPEQLRPEAEALARQMLAGVPEALVAYKRLLDAEAGTTLIEALRIERAASLANNLPVGRAEIDARLAKLRRVGR